MPSVVRNLLAAIPGSAAVRRELFNYGAAISLNRAAVPGRALLARGPGEHVTLVVRHQSTVAERLSAFWSKATTPTAMAVRASGVDALKTLEKGANLSADSGVAQAAYVQALYK
jgi:hypothetical protein